MARKIGIGNKIGIAVMALAGMMATAPSTASNANQGTTITIKDAVNKLPEAPKPSSIRKNFLGGDNPYKYYRKGNRNQKQYRRHVRSNPHLRRSKKIRIKPR